MVGASRVAWREGLFLRPQHFQQQDRFIDALVRAQARVLTPYPWGVSDLVINEGAAQIGKFAIERLTAVLPDGTSISIPGDSPPPDPIEIASVTRDAVVHVTLPAQQNGALEFQFRSSAADHIRHLIDEEEVYDSSAAERVSEPVELARPNLRFGVSREQLEGRVTLPLAKVTEVRNGALIFDPLFIPASLDVGGSTRLTSMITDILGRANQRVQQLSLRAVQSVDGGAATFAAFLLLMSLNRWSPVLTHMSVLPNLHPERLYEAFVGLAGELSTLTSAQRRPPAFAAYDHLNPQAAFDPVFELLKQQLSMAFQDAAGQLPLESIGGGAYTAYIDDHALLQNCALYLAVSTLAPAANVQAQFPRLVKIGNVAKMGQIVRAAIQAGVAITPVSSPPNQIQILPGFSYFQLDRSSPDWRDTIGAPSIGIHVAGNWPELKLELWWVKQVR